MHKCRLLTSPPAPQSNYRSVPFGWSKERLQASTFSQYTLETRSSVFCLQRKRIDSVSIKCQVTMVTGDATCLANGEMVKHSSQHQRHGVLLFLELLKFCKENAKKQAGCPVRFLCASPARSLANTTGHVGAFFPPCTLCNCVIRSADEI